LSKLYHPDLAKTYEKEADEKFAAVRSAWDTLGDSRKRCVPVIWLSVHRAAFVKGDRGTWFLDEIMIPH
jgi:hypothetical protein